MFKHGLASWPGIIMIPKELKKNFKILIEVISIID
jgi:hypothetical protein